MLTARIEGAISGLDVRVKSPDHIPDKVSGGTRKVDVSLRSAVGSAEVLVIVECRDRGRPADVTWIEQVKSKRDAVGAAKAIAVASGTFSKKALAAANAYGIDARTLAQVNSAEIKRWAGALRMFQHTAHYDNARITVVLGGTEPLPDEITARFDELVRHDAFNAKFISYLGTEGLFSPLDVVRNKLAIPSLPRGSRIKVTVPPKSSFVVSNDPTMMPLIGTLPEDGSSVARHHVLEFHDGEALFSLDGFARSILAVHLDFTVQVDSKIVDAQAYRYASSTGVIEVAEHTANIGGDDIIFTEHREIRQVPSSSSSKSSPEK